MFQDTSGRINNTDAALTQADKRRAAKAERVRSKIVLLAFVVYTLLLIEGAVRKWVAPEFARILFFVRDPFVLTIYFVALKNGLWPSRQPFVNVGLVLGAIGIAMIFIQSMSASDDVALLLGIYGWRAYFLYIPLAFIIGATFRRRDLLAMMRLTLWLAIPAAVIVLIQFWSPADTIINSGIAQDEALQFKAFGGVEQHIRPNGFFTSVAGHVAFVASTLAIVISIWLMPRREWPVSPAVLLTASIAVATCIGFSISRGLFLHSGLILMSAVIAASSLRGNAVGRALVVPIVLAAVASLLYPIVAPEGFESFATRWQGADAAESKVFALGIFGRALFGFYHFLDVMPDVPLTGFGIGYAGNAATILGIKLPVYAEDEWSRHMVDMGPLFGFVYIVFRIALTSWLGIIALRGVRRSGNALPLVLFGFAGLIVLNGQMTGHGSLHGFSWLFAGFILAASRVYQRGARGQSHESQRCRRRPVSLSQLRQVPERSWSARQAVLRPPLR